MTNIDKLKGIIVEKRLTLEKAAALIGVDRSTFYRKLSDGGEDFTIKQADKLVEVLELSPEDTQAIFFSQFVADVRHTERQQ